MRIALYQPDIPQNTGTILRMAACLGVPVDIISPAGFDMTDKALRRAGLDYLSSVKLTRHLSWDTYYAKRFNAKRFGADDATTDPADHPLKERRLVLLTTAAPTSYLDFRFAPDDTLLLGRESAGAPDVVHEAANARLSIPMRSGFRSLNIAVACSMVLGEALRQTGGFCER